MEGVAPALRHCRAHSAQQTKIRSPGMHSEFLRLYFPLFRYTVLTNCITLRSIEHHQANKILIVGGTGYEPNLSETKTFWGLSKVFQTGEGRAIPQIIVTFRNTPRFPTLCFSNNWSALRGCDLLCMGFPSVVRCAFLEKKRRYLWNERNTTRIVCTAVSSLSGDNPRAPSECLPPQVLEIR